MAEVTSRTARQERFVCVTHGTLVHTIVALGQSFGLSVIAEGVETEAQRDFLAHIRTLNTVH